MAKSEVGANAKGADKNASFANAKTPPRVVATKKTGAPRYANIPEINDEIIHKPLVTLPKKPAMPPPISASSVATSVSNYKRPSAPVAKTAAPAPELPRQSMAARPRVPASKTVVTNVKGGDKVAILVDIDNTDASLDNVMEIMSVMQSRGNVAYTKLYGYSDEKIYVFSEFIAEHRVDTVGKMRFRGGESVVDTRVVIDALRLALGGGYETIFVWTGVGEMIPVFAMMKDYGVGTASVDNVNYDTQNKFVDNKIRLFSPVVQPRRGTIMANTPQQLAQSTTQARAITQGNASNMTTVAMPVIGTTAPTGPQMPKAADIPMLDDIAPPILPRKDDITEPSQIIMPQDKKEDDKKEEDEDFKETEIDNDTFIMNLYNQLKREMEQENGDGKTFEESLLMGSFALEEEGQAQEQKAEPEQIVTPPAESTPALGTALDFSNMELPELKPVSFEGKDVARTAVTDTTPIEPAKTSVEKHSPLQGEYPTFVGGGVSSDSTPANSSSKVANSNSIFADSDSMFDDFGSLADF